MGIIVEVYMLQMAAIHTLMSRQESVQWTSSTPNRLWPKQAAMHTMYESYSMTQVHTVCVVHVCVMPTDGVVYSVYCQFVVYLVHWQLRSWPHLNPAIRRRTLGDTLSFGRHSSTLGNFLKFLLASPRTFTPLDNLYCLCVGVDNVFVNLRQKTEHCH